VEQEIEPSWEEASPPLEVEHELDLGLEAASLVASYLESAISSCPGIYVGTIVFASITKSHFPDFIN
jgi:hypothetical protein